MLMKKEWAYGLDNYRECVLEITDKHQHFNTTLIEKEFDPDRTIDQIFHDHVAHRQTRKLEILFSGGSDSIMVLSSCIRNGIPFEVITMDIRLDGLTINHRDLYCSEKFCREHGIPQKIITFEAREFFDSGKHVEYLLPYNVIEPHVAAHMWLIEQCSSFPIMCGDWPWVQTHVPEKVLSPIRSDYSVYDSFMRDKGISGVGNMIGYSFESTYYFIKKQLEFQDPVINEITIAKMKQRMYGLDDARFRSYGWENMPGRIVDFIRIKLDLLKRQNIQKVTHNVVWGDKIKQLLNTPYTQNDKFR